jgi:hypothetical protein
MATVTLEYFVAPEEAAAFIKVSVRRVKDMARMGTIPAHPVDPSAKRKDWRFLLSELAAFMGAHNSQKRHG